MDSASAAAPRLVSYRFRTMGTWATVTLVTPDSATSAADAAVAGAAFTRLDSLLSNWSDRSEISRVNLELARGATQVGPELALVLETGLRIGRASGGAFDMTVEPLTRLWGFLRGKPHVPDATDIAATLRGTGQSRVHFDPGTRTLTWLQDPQAAPRLDLGGIAKGYAVDEAARALQQRGVRDALVDLSGNMYAFGHPPDRDAWRIGVRDPKDRVPYLATIDLRDRAIATSAQYEQFVERDGRRYGHILDPRSGYPVDGVLSATVVAPTAMEADGWSTATFVRAGFNPMHPGSERPPWQDVLSPAPGISAVVVSPGTGLDTLRLAPDLRGIAVVQPGAPVARP